MTTQLIKAIKVFSIITTVRSHSMPTNCKKWYVDWNH